MKKKKLQKSVKDSMQKSVEAITPLKEMLSDRLVQVQDKVVERFIPQALPRLGVALSGGSARGFAHAGVFRFLEEKQVIPSVIAGTSAGSLFASFYADGYSSDEFLRLFGTKSFKDFTKSQIPREGLLKTDPLGKFLHTHLRTTRVEDLPIPVYIVATDIDSGECAVFDRGPLPEVVRASCSIPILFNPVEMDGHLYVDGGVCKNLPASVIRNKCNYLLGVHLAPGVGVKPFKKNIMGIALRSYRLLFHANSAHDVPYCDAVIESPELSWFSEYDSDAAHCFADIGYYLTKKLYYENKEFARVIDLLSGKPALPPLKNAKEKNTPYNT